MKNNKFEECFNFCKEFEDSEIPTYRIAYLNCLKEFVEFGKRMYEMNPGKELADSIEMFMGMVSEYSIYPKLGGYKKKPIKTAQKSLIK